MTLADLQKALDVIPAAAPGYTAAKSYNDGTVPEKFASSKFARLLQGSANKFRMNYARVPVTALCNRIRISSFGVNTDENASAYLRAQWQRNGMENLYKEIHEQAAATGSAYLVAWPDADDPTGESVDITVATQETTRVFYSAENTRKVTFAARMWVEGKITRVNLYYRDRIEKYASKANGGTKTARSYEPYIDVYEDIVVPGDDGMEMVESVAVWPIPNPFNMVPVFHFHIGGGYGRPVNRDAWEPQDATNKLASTMMAAVDFAGFPQRYVLQDPNTPVEQETDNFDDGETPGGAPSNTQDNGKLQTGPGSAWILPGKSAGQFTPAAMSAFLEPMEQYIKAISTTTDTPLHAFHGMGDAPSGESLRVANAPLNDKAINSEAYVEPTWIDLFSFLLDVGGFGTDLIVSLTWANPEMADDVTYWTAVKTKIQCGVPAAVALEQAGYTPDRIAEWVTNGALPTWSSINAAPSAPADPLIPVQ